MHPLPADDVASMRCACAAKSPPHTMAATLQAVRDSEAHQHAGAGHAAAVRRGAAGGALMTTKSARTTSSLVSAQLHDNSQQPRHAAAVTQCFLTPSMRIPHT